MCLSKNISITYLPLFEFQEEFDFFATQLFNYIKNDNHNSKTGYCIKILFSASNHLASLVQFKMFFFFYSFILEELQFSLQSNLTVIDSKIIC